MFVKPSSAFVGCPSVVCSSSGSAKKRAVGEVVAVDEEELRVAAPGRRRAGAPRRSASSGHRSSLTDEDRPPGRRETVRTDDARHASVSLAGMARARRPRSSRSPTSTSTAPATLLAERHGGSASAEPLLDPSVRGPVRGARRDRGALATGRTPPAPPRVARRRASSGTCVGAPRDPSLGPERLGRARRACRGGARAGRATSTRAAAAAGSQKAARALRRRPRDGCRRSSTPGSGRLRPAARPRDPRGLARRRGRRAAAGVQRSVRRRRDDIDALVALAPLLPAHQASRRSSRAPGAVEDPEEMRAEIVEELGRARGRRPRRRERRARRRQLLRLPDRGVVGARGSARARRRGLPRVRGHTPDVRGTRGRPRADRRVVRWARERATSDGHRLARDEPALVPRLAAARLPADLLPALPLDRLQ